MNSSISVVRNQQRNISQKQEAQNRNQNNNKNVSFKGVTPLFDYLATNPVWGATAVDVLSMGGPRTVIDTKKRGAAAGAETGFREFSSTVNDAAVGVYGLLAGTILAGMLSKTFGLKDPQRIFASNDSIDVHTNKWKANNGDVDKYINDYIDNFRGYNPTHASADAEGYVKIADTHRQSIFEDMKTLAQDGLSKKDRKVVTNRLNARILEATGAENQAILKHGDKATTASVSTMTDDFYRLTKAIKENKSTGTMEKFVSRLKAFGKSRAGLGLGLAIAISASAQPINVYLTKKRTGCDGFAGMPGREKDNSLGFKAMKAGSAAAMAGLALMTMKAKPSQVLDKVLYKGTAPTIDQFKALYATTICSRMLVARDKDELRECDTKDILGYLNWLVLGNFVNKGVVMAMQDKDNPLIKHTESSSGGVMEKLFGKKVAKFFNSDIASRKEVLAESLNAEGKSIIKADGKAMKLSEMIKALPKNSAAKKQLRILNIGQIANYAYSCAVLGLGIPSLNIAITESLEKKRKAKKATVVMTQNNQNFVDNKSGMSALNSMKSHRAN
ncbi:MAG: hypothetical protein NC200_02040 [Candidatus Gastranaerophilales bacterium]|nr:hypothetical protein [Candidatus Gastranaerophilales bacterium]